MKNRAVFLDRDGTINVDVGYPNNSSQIKIYPSSFEALRKINAAGFLVVIVTNQSGVGRGLLTEDNLEDIHQDMMAEFASGNIRIDGIYYCPHYDLSDIPRYGQNCSCRKPKPGLGFKAADDLGIDLANSYMIGDKVEDILFGQNIGARPVLVRTGFGASAEIRLREMGVTPAAVADDLLQAVDWILDHDLRKK